MQWLNCQLLDLSCIGYYIDSFFSFLLPWCKRNKRSRKKECSAFFPGLRTKTPIIWKVFIGFIVSGARRYFLIWLAPKGTMFRLVSAYSKKSLRVRRNPPSQCYGRQARCWKSQLSKDDDNYGIKHRTLVFNFNWLIVKWLDLSYIDWTNNIVQYRLRLIWLFVWYHTDVSAQVGQFTTVRFLKYWHILKITLILPDVNKKRSVTTTSFSNLTARCTLSGFNKSSQSF